MSPPNSGAEQFKTETVPGNFNSCVTCYAPWKFLLLQSCKGVVQVVGGSWGCLGKGGDAGIGR